MFHTTFVQIALFDWLKGRHIKGEFAPGNSDSQETMHLRCKSFS